MSPPALSQQARPSLGPTTTAALPTPGCGSTAESLECGGDPRPSTPRTQGRLQGFASPRLAQVTRRQNSNPEKMLPSSRHSSGGVAPGSPGLGNKATRMHPLRGYTVLTFQQSPERMPLRPPEPASGIVTAMHGVPGDPSRN